MVLYNFLLFSRSFSPETKSVFVFINIFQRPRKVHMAYYLQTLRFWHYNTVKNTSGQISTLKYSILYPFRSKMSFFVRLLTLCISIRLSSGKKRKIHCINILPTLMNFFNPPRQGNSNDPLQCITENFAFTGTFKVVKVS